MSNAKIVFMFSGQGSQYFQMGKNLFDRHLVFREYMLRLDRLVQKLSGNSVVEALYRAGHGKSVVFDRTLLSHPAIFMVEYALGQSLMSAGLIPDVNLGASLGSFAAAAMSGLIDVEDALTAVIGQATALEAYCEPGGMIAVLAAPTLFAEDFLAANAELAAVNLPTHFVVSAKRAACAAIEARLSERKLVFQRLPVSFAFHSRWIDPARARCESVLRSIPYKPARVPLMCCDHAAMLAELPYNYFWHIARRPIRFREAIAELERGGANRYVDLGPSGTLATFLKYCLPRASTSTAHAVLTPYGHDHDNLTALLRTSAGWHA